MGEPMLVCRKCGFEKSLLETGGFRCPQCGGPLDIMYDHSWNPEGLGLHRYSSMLPIKPHRTLGEGGTPIVEKQYRNLTVWFKLEYLNPSGSFKDRGTILAVEHAYRLGYDRVVEDTSGNTGISVTLYSRLYGLKPLIVMPRYAPKGKKILIRLLGGHVVEAEDRGRAAETAEKLASDKNYHVAHTWNPLYIVGAATISFEVFEHKGVPDIVIVPVGSGGLFLGIMRGFEMLVELGLADRVPRPIIVESVSVAPVYEAVKGVKPEGNGGLADGIMVPSPPRLREIIGLLTKHHGEVVVVDNNEIIDGWRKLFQMGFIVEPTSATTLAALDKCMKEEIIGDDETIMIPLTGSGLKTLDLAEKYLVAREPRPR